MIIRTPTNLHHAAVFPILLAYLPGSFDLEEICRADFFSPSFLFSFVFVCSCPEINPYLTFMNKGMRERKDFWKSSFWTKIWKIKFDRDLFVLKFEFELNMRMKRDEERI